MHSFTMKTERLLPRPLTAVDAPAAFEWLSDERVDIWFTTNTQVLSRPPIGCPVLRKATVHTISVLNAYRTEN